MTHSIPILLYHRIDNACLSTSTSPATFRRHLEWLSDRGWRSLSSKELTFFLQSGRPLPSRSFVITFDDGYESVASVAFDILNEFGYNAINFISTRFLRQTAAGAQETHPDANLYMTWDQVRALQASGVIDCQSHTHSHRRFMEGSLADLTQDLSISLDILSHETRLPKSHFSHLAWPWGMSTPEWRAVATVLGFKYQYTVSRQSYRIGLPLDDIPRTCFDAAAFPQFQRQLWLQSGYLSSMWDLAYPYGRKLRHFADLLR